MIDICEAKVIKINYKKLEEEIGVEVIPKTAGKSIGIDEVYSELLPGDKVSKVEEILDKNNQKGKGGYCSFPSENSHLSLRTSKGKNEKQLFNSLQKLPVLHQAYGQSFPSAHASRPDSCGAPSRQYPQTGLPPGGGCHEWPPPSLAVSAF